MPIFSISGEHGVGKSACAKALAEFFSLDYVSSGMIFRKMAKEHNMTLAEFSDYVEKHPEIDKMIDDRLIEYAKKGNVVLDARLSCWFTKDIADLKILLTAKMETRVERISKRDNVTYEEAYLETTSRENSERFRFKKLYNINVDDLSIYDIIIRTDNFSLKSVQEMVITAAKEVLKSKRKTKQ